MARYGPEYQTIPPSAIVPAADHALALVPRATHGWAHAARRRVPGRGPLALPRAI